MRTPPSPVRLRASVLVTFLAIVSPAALAAPDQHTGKHFAWRVVNANAPTFLLGSSHALSYSDYPLPSCYPLAVHNSKKVLFEYPPQDEAKFGPKLAKAAKYPKGQSLNGKVHKETYEFLIRACRNSSIRYESMLQFKPWAIGFFIWGVRGYNDVFSSIGVDAHLLKLARLHGKQVDGLVTLDEHVNVLAGLSDIESEVILLNAMVRGDKRKEDFKQLRAAWKRGDVDGLWALDQQTTNWPTSLNRRMLDDRNRKWVQKIDAEIKAGTPVTIVAGALHFAGPGSVIKMLQQKGYKLEQM